TGAGHQVKSAALHRTTPSLGVAPGICHVLLGRPLYGLIRRRPGPGHLVVRPGTFGPPRCPPPGRGRGGRPRRGVAVRPAWVEGPAGRGSADPYRRPTPRIDMRRGGSHV